MILTRGGDLMAINLQVNARKSEAAPSALQSPARDDSERLPIFHELILLD
jgi:hypothetical protein